MAESATLSHLGRPPNRMAPTGGYVDDDGVPWFSPPSNSGSNVAAPISRRPCQMRSTCTSVSENAYTTRNGATMISLYPSDARSGTTRPECGQACMRRNAARKRSAKVRLARWSSMPPIAAARSSSAIRVRRMGRDSAGCGGGGGVTPPLLRGPLQLLRRWQIHRAWPERPRGRPLVQRQLPRSCVRTAADRARRRLLGHGG